MEERYAHLCYETNRDMTNFMFMSFYAAEHLKNDLHRRLTCLNTLQGYKYPARCEFSHSLSSH